MANSTNSKLVIIIPIITTILLLSSISAIIGNAVLLANMDPGINRNYFINDLGPGELQVKSLNIPDGIDSVQITFNIDYFDVTSNSEYINIYLSEENLPSSITNVTELESSDYFIQDVIDSGTVNYNQLFFPRGNIDVLYIIIANPQPVEMTINVFLSVTDSGSSDFTDPGRVLAVVFSALFTALFLFLSLYLWLEFFEKTDRRFLTQGLEDKLQFYVEKALTWELVLFAVAMLFAISGYAEFLIGQGFGNLIFALIGFAFVYYNFNNRQRIEKNILNVLRSQSEISLEELSNQILEDKETTKKALLDAIMYSDLPAHLDLQTETVYYDPDQDFSQSDDMSTEVVQEDQFHVASTEVRSSPVGEEESGPKRPLPKCAYCDTEAISVNALFCHSCGASMSSAK